MRVSQPQCAADSLLRAAESTGNSADHHISSPLLWLLIGRAYMQTGQLEHADMALSQSNLLDPELPEPWGLLALISVR
jgi:cytochrome c-type biogenesis protein CcmH/NrfG